MNSKPISAAIDALQIIPIHIDLILKDDWFCDKWLITLHHKEKSMYFDYHTGIGHRNEKPNLGRDRDMFKNMMSANLKQIDSNRNYIKKWSVPPRPMTNNIMPKSDSPTNQRRLNKLKYLKADDIIHCLISDIQCLEHSSDKYEFMEEFGYEDFRKGEAVYNAILEQRQQLRELLGSYYNEWLEKEIKRLEDY